MLQIVLIGCNSSTLLVTSEKAKVEAKVNFIRRLGRLQISECCVTEAMPLVKARKLLSILRQVFSNSYDDGWYDLPVSFLRDVLEQSSILMDTIPVTNRISLPVKIRDVDIEVISRRLKDTRVDILLDNREYYEEEFARLYKLFGDKLEWLLKYLYADQRKSIVVEKISTVIQQSNVGATVETNIVPLRRTGTQ